MTKNKCAVGAVCDDDTDNLITCSGKDCGVTLHSACYGLPEDISSFACEKCAAKVKEPVCILCPDRKGAFKRTKAGDWVHVLCALYCPNVEFDNQETLSGIAVDTEGLGKTACCICDAQQGTSVPCKGPECVRAVHVTCAQRAGGLIFDLESVLEPYKAYCPTHGAGKQGGRDDETRDAVMAEAKEPAASAPDVKPEPQKEEAKSSKTTGEEGKAPGRDGNGKGSGKDAAAEGKTLKERSVSVEGKAGTGAGAGAGAVKPKAKDSRDARPAPPKEKTSGNSDNMQLSGVKRERYSIDINPDDARKKRRLSGASVTAAPAKDAATALDELLSKQQSDLKALIRSRVGGNLDALATMAPDVARLAEANKELQKQIAALEVQRRDLRVARDKLKSKKEPEGSKFGANLLRGCLLAFGVFSPQDVDAMDAVADQDALVKEVAEGLARHRDKDDAAAADREALFASIVSQSIAKLQRSDTA